MSRRKAANKTKRDLPPFELSDQPWFGPTKRARQCLQERGQLLAPVDALRVIVDALGKHAVHVERARFIDFRHREHKNFRYTIAITWIGSSPAARNAVYELGPAMAKRTGWYPLPQGEHIGSRLATQAMRNQLQRRRMPQFGVAGDLVRLENAVTGGSGTAIRVFTKHGSLLLDTGLPGGLRKPVKDGLVLLTHSHRDHSGGLSSAGLKDVPILLSETTCLTLVAAGVLDEPALLSRTILMKPGADLPVGNGVRVRSFPVPHCPGATGFVLHDRRAAVFYPGDVCLATARHDFLPQLLQQVDREPAPRKTVLLDATMSGRAAGASSADAADRLYARLRRGATDVVLCSRQVSQLMYAHIDLFWTRTQRPGAESVSHLLTSRARPLVEILHAAFIARAADVVDPFLVAQYGKTMSAWAESRWLYWMDHLAEIPSDGPRIWLVQPDELSRVKRGPTVVGAWIGSRGADDRFPADITELDLDTRPWTQHSDAASIAKAVRALSKQARVVLFHNRPENIDAFIAKESLSRCVSLGATPIRV